MEFFIISMLNGLSYGLLLFMLSSGLTLIFSMMGVLNFAHASFYMVGAYVGYTVSRLVGFWPALVIAPLVVGALGAVFERLCLRRVHKFGHVPELLVTFGLSYLILELVQLVWGRSTVPYGLPTQLQGPLFTLYGTQFPKSRSFVMLVALLMLVSVWLLPAEIMERALDRYPEVARAALKMMGARIRALGHQIEDLTLYPVMVRLARFLLAQAENPSLSGPGVTRAAIAAHLATTPETISRALAKLQETGTIRFDRHTIIIVNVELLKSVAVL